MGVIEVTAIASMVMELLGLGANQASLFKSAEFTKKVAKFKQALTRQLSDNSSEANKLYHAYINKDSQYANSLIGRSPIGPSYQKLLELKSNLLKEYNEQDKQVNAKNAHINSALNSLASAENMAGNIFNSKEADDMLKTAAEQAVAGGLKEAKDYVSNDKKETEYTEENPSLRTGGTIPSHRPGDL